MRRKAYLIAAFIGLALAALFLANTLRRESVYVFDALVGPEGVTVVAAEATTDPKQYEHGSRSRMAVLLTDPSAPWLGVAHGLKSIGIPFLITSDYEQALQHKVVLVYPMISGSVLSPQALQALAAFPRNGGTLIAVNVLGGGLEEVFGFKEAIPSKQRFEIRFAQNQAGSLGLIDVRERAISLGQREKLQETFGTYGYTQAQEQPLALYDDGSAAITQRSVGQGKAYALGLDIGAFILKGYNNREEWIARSYVNEFEPALDVLLRLIRQIYIEGETDAVTLGTVPYGRSLAVMITHDIDYTKSLPNSIQYAELEKRNGIRATYFMQTKYIRDYNDEIFFRDTDVPYLKQLEEMGMELGSHTVSHSRQFAKFALGTGEERYPSYRPFVKDPGNTVDGTILGELRVSKFLIERFGGDQKVISFRPGVLSNPYLIPQALIATGYRFSSSVTANNSLTHLPFQLNYGRDVRAEVELFEFPVTIEDEAPPKMGQRLQPAIELAQKISAYGGIFVILIHPDIIGHKFEFERGFIEAFKDRAWFGSISDFGGWWSARNRAELDVASTGSRKEVRLNLPQKMEGVSLKIPSTWTYQQSEPRNLKVTAERGTVVVENAAGALALYFSVP